MCAAVAGLFIPSKVPLTVSFEPASIAETEPDPVMLAFIAVSTATGASRVLNVSGLCAGAHSANQNPIARATQRLNIEASRARKNMIPDGRASCGGRLLCTVNHRTIVHGSHGRHDQRQEKNWPPEELSI